MKKNQYYKPLVEISKKNIQVTNKTDQIKIINDDARNFEHYLNTDHLIVFLYNPFGEQIMTDVLSKLKKKIAFIIYMDPAHDFLVKKAGFKTIISKKGAYPNRCINIYKI